MNKYWYALQSKPNKEELLQDQLSIRKVQVYYPCLQVKPVNPRSRRLKPFFPGYMFIHVDLHEIPLSSLAWIPGTQRLLSFDGEPAIIPPGLVEAIQSRVEILNQKGGFYQQVFSQGEVVQITSGAFSGYQAIFDRCLDGTERVRVLIKLLQDRQVRLEIPAGLLMKAAT